jgi:hypothetical protein
LQVIAGRTVNVSISLSAPSAGLFFCVLSFSRRLGRDLTR